MNLKCEAAVKLFDTLFFGFALLFFGSISPLEIEWHRILSMTIYFHFGWYLPSIIAFALTGKPDEDFVFPFDRDFMWLGLALMICAMGTGPLTPIDIIVITVGYILMVRAIMKYSREGF